MDIHDFVSRLPKTELHLHLEGSVCEATARALAVKHGLWRSEFDAETGLYSFSDLQRFLAVYRLVAQSMVDASDFHRTTYECLSGCAESGARYVELFFSPDAHRESGVPYHTMMDGISAALRDIEMDHGLVARLVPAHNRELGLHRGMEFLEMVIEHRTDDVIGIGLDYDEVPHPPAQYAPLFLAARRAGLFTTAHAGETAPATYVGDTVDVLHVDRIDHGYHVVDDPALLQRIRQRGLFMTVCPTTTTVTTSWRDLSSPSHAIRTMIDEGLNVTVNSDDPGLFRTTLANEYARLMSDMGLSPRQLSDLALAGLHAAWLDESVKKAWAAAWTTEVDVLLSTMRADE